MKHLVVCAVFIFLAVSTCVGQSSGHQPGPASHTKAEQAILELERKWADAYVRNDADFIAGLMADDFLGDHMVLKSWIESIRSKELTHESAKHENLQVRVYKDVAVLRGYAVGKGRNKGEDISGRYRFMDVFKKRKGRWQVIASQSVRVPSQ